MVTKSSMSLQSINDALHSVKGRDGKDFTYDSELATFSDAVWLYLDPNKDGKIEKSEHFDVYANIRNSYTAFFKNDKVVTADELGNEANLDSMYCDITVQKIELKLFIVSCLLL